jgi:DNA replication and repair protein RecF
MFYSSIQLINFRNYEKQNLKLHEGVNVFVGQNGQGKTNLLESVYFMAKGKSFRPGKSHHFLLNNEQHQTQQSSLQGVLCYGQFKNLVRVNLTEDKKQIFINQKKTNGTKLAKTAPCILFSPESLSAIKEGPEQRRDLVDGWLVTFSLQNYKVLTQYKKVLTQRNRLLKDIKTQKISRTEGERLLQALNPSFLNTASELTKARIDALDIIEPLLAEAMREISGESLGNVEISVDYQVSGVSQKDSDLQRIHDSLAQRLAELQSREVISGHSLIGPHKHDISFLFAGEDSRYHCSQGQQRALILSFKMAQIMYHYRVYQSYPILLLDDVLSELDKSKQANLVRFLTKIDSQIFITTTDFEFPFDFGDRDMAIYQVEQGHVQLKSE